MSTLFNERAPWFRVQTYPAVSLEGQRAAELRAKFDTTQLPAWRAYQASSVVATNGKFVVEGRFRDYMEYEAKVTIDGKAATVTVDAGWWHGGAAARATQTLPFASPEAKTILASVMPFVSKSMTKAMVTTAAMQKASASVADSMERVK